MFALTPSPIDKPRGYPGHCQKIDDYCCHCDFPDLLIKDDDGNVREECRGQGCPDGEVTIRFGNDLLVTHTTHYLNDGQRHEPLESRLSNGNYVGTITPTCDNGQLRIFDHSCVEAPSGVLPGQEYYEGCFIDQGNLAMPRGGRM